MHIDNVSTNGLPVAIHVEGNVIRKEYNFKMGNMNNNPFKIARVVRKLKLINATDSYFIEIGPNVDVAMPKMKFFLKIRINLFTFSRMRYRYVTSKTYLGLAFLFPLCFYFISKKSLGNIRKNQSL